MVPDVILPSVAIVAAEFDQRWRPRTLEMHQGHTYVPELTALNPKLLPTTPVHEQLRPLASTHFAVAVLSVLKHVMAEIAGGKPRKQRVGISQYIADST